MLLTPFDPSAGPTGGLGEANPAPTISFTIWSPAATFLAIVLYDICTDYMELVERFRRGSVVDGICNELVKAI